MDKQWMTEYFYPRFWHNSIMHGSDKFIVLLLKKSIAIMIKGKIRNKRVRKSFLEGKKSRSFWLRLFFGRWKGAGFLCWSRQSPEQPKDGAFFLRCETMERANLNKHGTKQVAGRNAVSIRKPAYASSQAEAGKSRNRRGEKPKKRPWQRRLLEFSRRKNERNFLKKKNPLATSEKEGECEEKQCVFTVVTQILESEMIASTPLTNQKFDSD